MRYLLILFVMIFSIGTVSAQEPVIKIKKTPAFDLPIDCKIGMDCWIINYVDYGLNDGVGTDMSCLKRSYDNHKGTDFAILDGVAMEQGVDVLAPMAGTVKKVRDGEPDRWPTEEDLKAVQDARKECGNAILIDHGNEVETLYCHLKNGSIEVQPGDEVKTGDALAEVGLSGFTQFPHVHFGVLKSGNVVDPFTALGNTEKCGTHKKSLWDKSLSLEYDPVIIQAVGISDTVPSLEKIERNAIQKLKLDSDAPVIVFWATYLGVREGDKILMEVRDPNDKVLMRRELMQERTRARQFYYVGKNLAERTLAEGAYTATAKIIREQEEGAPIVRFENTAFLVVP